MRRKLDMATESQHMSGLLGAHCCEARFGRMAGTILGVKATTVFCAKSRKVRIHSIAVD
jgi:hypothetical protein